MTKLPLLALKPDDQPFVGQVVSYSRESDDTFGDRFILILEPLGGNAERVKFLCPSQDFWSGAISLRLVQISRPTPAEGRIAHYKLAQVGAQPTANSLEEAVMGMMRGKEVAAHVAGAYDMAAKTIKWYNSLHEDFQLAPEAVGPLAHTLMIAHQRGELEIPPYKPSTKDE